MAGPEHRFIRLWARIWAATAMALAALCFAAPASAQVNQYSNTTSGAINDQTCGGTVLTRTFVVGTSYTVSDVNIGILLSHTYRSDLEIRLQSPAGTIRNIMISTGGDGDNLNDMFDDEATANISTHTAAVTDPLTPAPPPYSHSFQPTQALSTFDGQNALGTWTLTICDNAAQDTGTFTRADLYITQIPSNYADLSLTKTVSNAAPAFGATISYTLGVTNAAGSPLSATGVQVLDVLPAGVTFVSATGTGTYNSGTGIWTVGTLAPGASASLTITVTVAATAGATVQNTAEVWVSSVADLDSTPANNSITEDDDAQVSFTVSGARVAGTPPTLVCAAGTTLHDWDAITWAAGSTSNAYAIANIGTVNWGITNGGTWLNNATYGGQSPAEQTAVTGGLAGGQQSLFQLTDMPTQTAVAVTTITLPTAVPGLQMRIFDIDYNAGQFADRITVTGTFAGNPVTPTLTNGVANYVIGNSAYGDATSGDTSANGNIWVTFLSPVDTIVITYGNHSLAPANPGQQAIAIHDITFCRPVAALSITKTSTVISDPINGATDPKMIPGAVVEYCILASNAGSGTTTNVVITDTLPANVTYVTGGMTSATGCGLIAGNAEDEDAIGADESDPFGMQLSGTTVGGTATSIGPSSTFAMRFRVTVN
ncbi:MAG: proprotein convertase P-domain-containing protein [Sphingopyxis sp.]